MTHQPNSKRWGESFAALARWTREHGQASALLDLAAAKGLAELSREVLHEFNNLMTAVIGYTDMAARKLPVGGPEREHVQKAMSAAERAAQLAQEYLAFGRELSEPAKPREVLAMIAEKQQLLERFCGSRLRFVSRVEESARSARVEQDAFFQLVTCFILHARQALTGEGTVALELGPADPSPEKGAGLRVLLTCSPASSEESVELQQDADSLGFLRACCAAIAARAQGELSIQAQAGETRLELLLPHADGGKARVRVYATAWCSYCRAAKRLLAERGVPFEEIDLTHDDAERARIQARWNWSTVPLIIVDGALLGGYSELAALDREGGLEPLRGA